MEMTEGQKGAMGPLRQCQWHKQRLMEADRLKLETLSVQPKSEAGLAG